MLTSRSPGSRCISGVVLALTFAAAHLPIEAEARSLNLHDLIEEESRQRALQQQKLDRFQDPKLFALLREANIALTNSDFTIAEIRARALIERSPASPQGWHLLGLALANLGDIDGAIDALDAADARYDVNAGPLVVKGELLLARGEAEAAREAFLAAIDKDPADWRAQESVASIALASGDVSSAISRLENVVKLAEPDYFDVRVRLASLYLGEERIEEAKGVLGSFAEANPDHAGVRIALGRIAFSEGRNDEATRLFDAAIALEPDVAQHRLFKARAELNARRFADAEATLTEAIAAFPDEPSLQLELGGLYGVTTDYARALGAFEAGAARWPDRPQFAAAASRAAYRLGDFETALAHAEAVAGRDSASATDQAWLGAVLERLDRPEPAIAAYEKAVAGDPSNWIALNNLASLIADKNPNRARDLARRALELSGGNDQVRATLGWALYKTGEAERSLAIFRDLAAGKPDSALYAYRLGRILTETGETEAGRAELARALAIDPVFPYAEDAKALLAP